MYADVWTNNPTIEKASYGTAEGDKRSMIEATLSQVGQIPPQLFSEAHPTRNVQQLQYFSALKKESRLILPKKQTIEMKLTKFWP